MRRFLPRRRLAAGGLTISLDGGLCELEESLRSRAISDSSAALCASNSVTRASRATRRASSRLQLGHSDVAASAMMRQDTQTARADSQEIRERLPEPRAGKTEDEAALYRLVDWSRTVAYGCGFSSLYINLRGREGNGVVDPSKQSETIEEIAARLEAYRDPQTGTQPVRVAYRGHQIHNGPHRSEGPDLIPGMAPGYRMGWQTAVGGLSVDVVTRNERHWCGDHIVDPAVVPGAILSNVPSRLADATVTNVAPTILGLAGLVADRVGESPPLELAES